jgi:hypothetical protein
MTPSTEWPASDQGNVATPDLFGGELFGDELIDMYNADAVVGNDDGGKCSPVVLVWMRAFLTLMTANFLRHPKPSSTRTKFCGRIW